MLLCPFADLPLLPSLLRRLTSSPSIQGTIRVNAGAGKWELSEQLLSPSTPPLFHRDFVILLDRTTSVAAIANRKWNVNGRKHFYFSFLSPFMLHFGVVKRQVRTQRGDDTKRGTVSNTWLRAKYKPSHPSFNVVYYDESSSRQVQALCSSSSPRHKDTTMRIVALLVFVLSNCNDAFGIDTVPSLNKSQYIGRWYQVTQLHNLSCRVQKPRAFIVQLMQWILN